MTDPKPLDLDDCKINIDEPEPFDLDEFIMQIDLALSDGVKDSEKLAREITKAFIIEALEFWFKYRYNPRLFMNDFPEHESEVRKECEIIDDVFGEPYIELSLWEEWLLKFAFKEVFE